MFRSYYTNYDDSLSLFISTHEITPDIIPRYHFNADLYKCVQFLSEKVVTPLLPSPPLPSGCANTGQRGTNKAENGFVQDTIVHR